jgi:hypothetical protein
MFLDSIRHPGELNAPGCRFTPVLSLNPKKSGKGGGMALE